MASYRGGPREIIHFYPGREGQQQIYEHGRFRDFWDVIEERIKFNAEVAKNEVRRFYPLKQNPLALCSNEEVLDICDEVFGPGPRPTFLHNCADCRLLGTWQGADVYICEKHGYGGGGMMLIARYSNIARDTEVRGAQVIQGNLMYGRKNPLGYLPRPIRKAVVYLQQNPQRGWHRVRVPKDRQGGCRFEPTGAVQTTGTPEGTYVRWWYEWARPVHGPWYQD